MRFICLLFALLIYFNSDCCLAQQSNSNQSNSKTGIEVPIILDTVNKKQTIISKIKNAFRFSENFKKGEEKRIIAIVDKLNATHKSTDTVVVNHNHITNNTVPIRAIQREIDSLFLDFTNSVDSAQISNIDIQNLVDQLLPMMQKKIELEKIEEKRALKVTQIRVILPFPLGTIDTIKKDKVAVEIVEKKIVRRAEVFGFHPYWMNRFYLNYNFEVLHTLAYFGYELNGKTGDPISLHGWKDAEVITKAKAAGCKVVLCIFDKNGQSIHAFLQNPKAQTNLIYQIKLLLKQRNADGINVYFEPFKEGNTVKFTNFIRELSQNLRAENPNYTLSITVPVLDKNFNYDLRELDTYVDRFIIDFTKKNSYGAINPIKNSKYSLNTGIDRYLNQGVSPKKFIACITYNGILWNYKSSEFHYKTYDEILKNYSDNAHITYDENAGPRIDILENKTDTIAQLWYDDAASLAAKYDFIINKGISAIGIWGLGYDNDNPELWNVLIDKTMDIKIQTKKLVPPKKMSWITQLKIKLKEELKLYQKLFKHPCTFTEADKAKMYSDDIIILLVKIIFISTILISIYCIWQIKIMGQDWKKKKLFCGILIGLSALLALGLLFCLFLNPDSMGFKVDENSMQCETNFSTALKILCGGFIFGLIAMKFLIFPLLKTKEIP